MPHCHEKYKWCKGLSAVINVDGTNYCVFHAPKGTHKGQTPENFNKMVYGRIKDAKDNNTECDLSGTIFPWHIDFRHFDKHNPFPIISFSNAIFHENVYFTKATFSGDAHFDKVTFKGFADYMQTIFQKNADFIKAIFNGNTNFIGANFSEEAFFMEAIFNGRSDFRKAVFTEVAQFNNANFTKDAIFTNATFGGVGFAQFAKAIFSKEAHFDKIDFNGDVKFSNAVFNGDVYFQTTNFNKSLYLGWSSVNKSLYFEGVDLSKVSFLNSDPQKMHFIGCTWPRHFGRNILSDEINAKSNKTSFDKVEYLYRRLKQKYKEEYNEAEASNWHYGEKEMFRKKKLWRRYNPFSFSNLYWTSSGYGERPVRAGLMLILLFVAVTILMNIFGLDARHGNPVFGVESIKGFSGAFNFHKFWLLINNTIQHTLFIRDTYFIPQNLAGSIILTLSTKLIMPIQTALFVLALRNKFRR